MLIRIGTRGSKLALAQTALVEEALHNEGARVEIVLIKTSGDRRQAEAAPVSDKKEWIYELELALLKGEIDAAIHSGKDVPIEIEKGTEIFSCLKRAAPEDVFIGRADAKSGRRLKFSECKPGDAIGTASLRRKAQLLRKLPGLQIVDHRGNVPTRVRKLDDNTRLSGIVLARAGLDRLGLTELSAEPFSFEDMLPAMCQGTLAIQVREGSSEISSAFRRLINLPTERSLMAERSCVAKLGADCNSALSVYALAESNSTSIEARILSEDGSEILEDALEGSAGSETALGAALAERLIGRGAMRLLGR